MGYEVGAAVLMVEDASVTGTRLEQLCVQKGAAEERARRASVVLSRAEAEARSRQLTRLVASGVALGVEEAGWLAEAGFALDTESEAQSDGVDLLDRACWPRWCKLL